MEESISGFKLRGDWGDIVEHGERITRALRDAGVHDPDRDADARYADAFDEWDEWRPKAHETLDSDVSEKTADQASVEEGKGEKAGKKPDEDIKTAGEKLSESYEQLEEDDAGAAVDNWKESIDYVARAADSASRKALRRVEDTVYQNVMTQLAPYYFDNELVSANVQQSTRNGGNGEQFVFEVNVNDDELKEEVSDRLAEYEDEVDRWHVEVEKDTDAAEAIEGAEPPPEPDDNSRSTTN
jgi:vacuolar-type H+-ATPase subunit I/STV1